MVNVRAGDYIRGGWELFKANPGLFLGIGLVGVLINSVGSIVTSGPIQVGWAHCALKQRRTGKFEFADMFEGFQNFLPAFLAGLLVMVFTCIGIALCIIPGIIVAALYCLTWFFIADKKMDYWPAMETSRKIVWDNFGGFFWLLFLLFLLNILGAICCYVGIFVTMPVSFCAMALAYEDTMQQLGMQAPPVVAQPMTPPPTM
jgi:uncharacterized membrane protein